MSPAALARKSPWKLSALLLLLCLASCAEQLDNPERIARARQSITEKNFRFAIIDLRLLDRQSPENPEVSMLLGIAHAGSGNFARAIDYFEIALLGDQAIDEFRIPFAESLLETRQFVQALEFADPNYAVGDEQEIALWLLRGDTYAASGAMVNALICYAEARSLSDNDNVALLRSAEVFWEIGNFRDARAMVEEALRIDPTQLQSYWILAEILSDQGDKAGAVAVYESAISNLTLEKRDAAYFLADMADSQLRYGDVDGTKRTLKELNEIWPSNDAFPKYIEAQLALLDGDVSAAMQLTQTYLTEYQDRPETSWILGEGNFRLGNLYQAESRLKDAAEEEPNNSNVRNSLVRVHIAQDRIDYAIDVLQDLIASGTNDNKTIALFGLLEYLAAESEPSLIVRQHLLDADYDEIRRYADSLIAADTRMAEGLCLLGLLDLHDANYSSAIESFRAGLVSEPQNPLLVRGLALVFLANGDNQAGLDALRGVPADFLYRGLLLDALQSDNKSVLGIDDRTLRWLKSHSSDHEVRLWFAWSLLGRGGFAAAAEQYEALLASGRQTANIHSNLARSYLMMGDARALEHGRISSELDSENSYVLDTYGSILVSNESVDAGIESFRKARFLEPGDGMLAYRMADALLQNGEKVEASQLLTELLDHKDQHAATMARGRLETVSR